MVTDSAKKRKIQAKRRKIKKYASFSFLIFAVSVVVFALLVKQVGILPGSWYRLFLLFFVLILGVAGYYSLIPAVKNSGKIIQTCLNGLLAVVLVVASILMPVYMGKVQKIFVEVPSEGNLNIDVYVLADSEITDIQALSDAKVAILKNSDTEYQEYAIKVVNKEITGNDIQLVYADSIYDSVDKLLAKEVDAILLNEAYVNIIEDNNDYQNFASETKMLYQCTQKITLAVDDNAVSDITSEPFIIGIIGQDDWSSSQLTASSGFRSDVNMVVAVNPKTHCVALITLPRDSYVGLYGDSSKMDKLTHSPVVKGVSGWLDTVEGFLGVDINYYLRVNFASLVDIVDAVDGIDIDNPYQFSTGAVCVYNAQNNTTECRDVTFQQGQIHIDGAEALGYCRERYSLSNGDLGRNQHQQIIIKALINKLCTPSIIKNASSLLDAVAGKFNTNLKMNDIIALVQYQLDEMADWSIESYSVTFDSSVFRNSYIAQTELSVVIVNQASVNTAKQMLNKVISGQ